MSELTLPHPFLSSLLRTLLSLSNWVREMRERYERETQPINDGGSEEGWAIISLPVSFPFIPLVIHSTARRSQGKAMNMRGKEWPHSLSLSLSLSSPLSHLLDTRWTSEETVGNGERMSGETRHSGPAVGFILITHYFINLHVNEMDLRSLSFSTSRTHLFLFNIAHTPFYPFTSFSRFSFII